MKPVKLRCLLVVTLALVSGLSLAACGTGSFAPSTKRAVLPSGQPGKGKPAVTLGDKNFTEQFILGELYAQALRAKGYTVNLKPDIGPSGVTDAALVSGQIDLYPEYTGVIISALQDINLAAPGGASAPAKSPPGPPSRPTSRRPRSRTAGALRCSTPRRSRTPTGSPARPRSPTLTA